MSLKEILHFKVLKLTVLKNKTKRQFKNHTEKDILLAHKFPTLLSRPKKRSTSEKKILIDSR